MVVVGFEGENSARFMGEGCFIGLAGFLGDLATSTLRTGDLTGEQRRSSSWLTVTLLGEALGKRFALFGWIEGDLHGVRAFRAGLTGVLNGLASFEGEQKRFWEQEICFVWQKIGWICKRESHYELDQKES